jgi:hypothetical protein
LTLAACQAVPLVSVVPTATSTPAPSPTPTQTPTPLPTETPGPTPTRSGVPNTGDPYALVMSESEVNNVVQGALSGQTDVPLSDVYIRLDPGQAVASGKVALGFASLDLETAVTATVQNGRPVLQITEIKMGGQKAPSLVRDQVLRAAQPYLDQFSQFDLAVTIESIQIRKGQLRVTGTYK